MALSILKDYQSTFVFHVYAHNKLIAVNYI